MIIVFFEYDARPYFFGVTSGKQTTGCSLSYNDVAAELFDLQKAEWKVDTIDAQPTYIQGTALRRFEFVEGRWVLVDVVDGIMTVVADMHDGDGCFLISANEPNEVFIAEATEVTDDLIAQAGSSYGG